jgi:hypothetical protein
MRDPGLFVRNYGEILITGMLIFVLVKYDIQSVLEHPAALRICLF